MAEPTTKKVKLSPIIDEDGAKTLINEVWDKEIIATLSTYIAMENSSPSFDPDWESNGSLDAVIELFYQWALKHGPNNAKVRKVKLEGRTPCLLVSVPASSEALKAKGTVLLYAHADKQPPLEGQWSDGLGPRKPVLKDGKLYGRGGADDGYGMFAALTALQVLRTQGVEHGEVHVLIETCEESGSFDLPHYVSHLQAELGNVSLVVCLDSGAGDYERLWLTTSLRGMLFGDLRVDVIPQGVHSGHAGGIVPSTFRIARTLLSRLEDQESGNVIAPASLVPSIPTRVLADAKVTADILGDEGIFKEYGLYGSPESTDNADLLVRRTYQANLSVVGVEGIPTLADAGNVRRPYTTLTLSIRLPPHANPDKVKEDVTRLLTEDPPYGAKVSFTTRKAAGGFQAPTPPSWLSDALAAGSAASFGNVHSTLGEGGSIPFMGLLLAKFPQAAFVVTGVLGPHSNAHGPDEMLHIQAGKNVTFCVANVLAAHARS